MNLFISILVIFAVVFVIGWIILFIWMIPDAFEDKYRGITFTDSNETDFFPNFDKFKSRVEEVAENDEETRDYLKSRQKRMDNIKKVNNDKRTD